MPRGPAALTAPVEPEVAAELLHGWGFLVHPDLPDLDGDAYLLVALRAAPELDHFDPERIELWASDGARGDRLEITRASRPVDKDYSWGTIRVVDRFGIANEFVSMGGRLAVHRAGDTTVAIFTSCTPILRRGGHSQGWDAAAADMAAFFGRLLLAVDLIPGFERRLASATPLARYATFLADAIERHRASPLLRAEHGSLWTLLCAERGRLEHDHPIDWAAGQDLLVAARAGMRSSAGRAPAA